MTKEEEAIQYIQNQLRGGISQDSIIEEMARAGWSYRIILGLIEMAKNTLPSSVPPSAQPAPARSSQNGPVIKTGTKKIKLIVGIVALGTVLIAGGVYAYYQLTNPNPEEVLRKMTAETASVQSLSFSLEGTLEPPASSTGQLSSKVTFALSGDFNMQDRQNPEYDLHIKENTGTGAPFPIVIDGEMIYLDKIAYLKINPGTLIGPLSLNVIADQWIEINPASLAATSSLLAAFKVQVPTSQLNVTPEQAVKIKNLVKNAFFFEDIRNLSGETIDGVETYHYGFKPDIAAISDLVRNIGGVLGVSSTPAFAPSSTSTIESTYASTTWEIWIGKSDYRMRKLLVTGTPGSSMTLTISNYNKVPEILAPLNAKPIEDVLGTIFGGVTGGK